MSGLSGSVPPARLWQCQCPVAFGLERADIGGPGMAGGASYSGGTWSVSGGGADIWNSADQFHFAYASTTSNAIVAKVLTQDDTNPWAKSGVMFRDSVDASSVYVDMVATPGNGVSFQWRDTYGGPCGYSQGPSLPLPIWVKLVNSGGVFTAFYSLDGSDWIQVGSPVAVSMSGTPLAGLCVTAHDDTALNTSTFSNVAFSNYTPPPPPVFGIYRQLWTGLPSVGNSLDMLTNTANNPDWPDNPNPTFTTTFTNFETEINSGKDNYGQRLRTFVIPPTNGDYVFWISSDDSSALYLSSDENPADRVQIASVNQWTGSREWSKEANQQSAPISLQAGRRYYLEARMQQGGGGDNLAVRWQLPDGAIEEPMTAASAAGTRMIPFTALDREPGIYRQTTNVSVVEGMDAVFSVLVTNQAPVTYRWSLDGAPLPGALAARPVYSVEQRQHRVEQRPGLPLRGFEFDQWDAQRGHDADRHARPGAAHRRPRPESWHGHGGNRVFKTRGSGERDGCRQLPVYQRAGCRFRVARA